MKNSTKSKGVSGSDICEQGGTLADLENAYCYELAYDRYFAGIVDTVLSRYLHGADVASDTYDGNLGSIAVDGVYF